MQLTQLWLMFATVLPIAVLQWWGMRSIERKRIANVRARHLKSLQSADKLLQQSRQQNAQLQQELAAARLAVKRLPRPEPSRRTPHPEARETLMRILDEAPPTRRALPVDGFAETMPSLQFPPGSTFGNL